MNLCRFSILFILCGFLAAPDFVFAGNLPWRNHANPFDFLFENHIDTHQQTQMLPDGTLFGYLYITFTGETDENGIPIAEHRNCENEGVVCRVGWELKGIPGSAVFFTHQTGDYPVWEVERTEIPQPGAYTHFHWQGPPQKAHDLVLTGEAMNGYFLQLTARDTFVFRHGDYEVLVTNGLDNATHLNIASGLAGALGGHAQ